MFHVNEIVRSRNLARTKTRPRLGENLLAVFRYTTKRNELVGGDVWLCQDWTDTSKDTSCFSNSIVLEIQLTSEFVIELLTEVPLKVQDAHLNAWM